jgi:hypothetical protein
MSSEEERPEAGESIEQMKAREAESLKEIDQELERVDQMIDEAKEKAKQVYKLDQG